MADQPAPLASSSVFHDSAVLISNNQELVDIFFAHLNLLRKRMISEILGEGTICVYNSHTSPYIQQIANMFDIDIKGESEEIARILLAYPIFSKAHIGTKGGVNKVLAPIISEMEFKTHANTTDMEPYHFVIEAVNTMGLPQKKIISLVNRFACLRDNPTKLVLTDVACNEPYLYVCKVFYEINYTVDIDKEVC